MIDYGTFHFSAPLLTGASWFQDACRAVGLRNGNGGSPHEPFDDGDANVLRVSLVRHPCNWLGAAFAIGASPLVGLGACDSFDDLVRQYLTRTPGAIGRLFNRYRADSVYKIEDMPWAFAQFVEVLGLDRPQLAHLPLPTSLTNNPPEWDKSLWRQVIQAEREVAERYDYW